MISNGNTFDRIVTYFHALASEPFDYRGQTLQPYKKFVASPKVFQSYTCPEGCGACCSAAGQVWLIWDDLSTQLTEQVVDEEQREGAALQGVQINHETRLFFVDQQVENTKRGCKYLSEKGRCNIYHNRPLPCRLEFFRFIHYNSGEVARAQVGVASRKWALTRVDGQKGGQCEIRPYDPELTKTHIRDLKTIQVWMNHFHIANNAGPLISWMETGPHDQPLTIWNRHGFLED